MSILPSSLAPLPWMIVSLWHHLMLFTTMPSAEIPLSNLVLPSNNPPGTTSFIVNWLTLHVGPLIVTLLQSLCDDHKISFNCAAHVSALLTTDADCNHKYSLYLLHTPQFIIYKVNLLSLLSASLFSGALVEISVHFKNDAAGHFCHIINDIMTNSASTSLPTNLLLHQLLP